MGKKRKVMVVGQHSRSEFREGVNWLSKSAELLLVRDMPQALSHLAGDTAVELIYVAEAYAGEYSTAQIEALQRSAPLAQILALVGNWSEGETRSGDAWPGVERIYAHQFGWRLQSQSRASSIVHQRPNLACTVTEDERWLSRAGCHLPQRNGLAVVCSHSDDDQHVLGDLVRAIGFVAVAISPTSRVSSDQVRVVVIDAPRNRAQRQEEIRRLTAAFAPAPLLVLISFPRPDEIAESLECGAHCALAKPFVLEDLVAGIDSCLQRHQNVTSVRGQ